MKRMTLDNVSAEVAGMTSEEIAYAAYNSLLQDVKRKKDAMAGRTMRESKLLSAEEVKAQAANDPLCGVLLEWVVRHLRDSL
jgi:hypothetical protein